VLRAVGLTAVALELVLALGAEAASRECPDGLDQILVPAGVFWMGSDANERALANRLSSPETIAADWFRMESPRYPVQAEAFCIDRHLVTQEGYLGFVTRTRRAAPGISHADYRRQGFLVHDYADWTPYLWKGRTPPRDRLDHPVVLVSAYDAEAYCRWRHPAGRLPSEGELEKAARGTDGRIFPWGDSWDPGRLNSAARGPQGTTPVGRYEPGASPFGILDAVGNVFQWTSTQLPSGLRALKGCAWDDDAGLCRPAARHGRPASSRHILIGFRCAGRPADH
jgi:formylglycine-generating enzyme required for sulfatase activity